MVGASRSVPKLTDPRRFFTSSNDASDERAPRLHVLAGPNGSGKSTFTRDVLAGRRAIDYELPPNIINPDVIAHRLNPDNPDAVARAAGEGALNARKAALANREDFAVETTLTGYGARKLIGEAKRAGYEVTMTYVCVNDVEIAVQRVQERALREHRTVSPEVVRRRYPESLAVFRSVAPELERIDVYDNSAKALQYVARLERGRVVSIANNVPAWVEHALREPLAIAHDRAIVAADAAAHLRSKQSSAFLPAIEEEDVSNRQSVSGEVIVTSEHYAAITTGPSSFAIVERSTLDRALALAQQAAIELHEGRGRTVSVDPSQGQPRRRGR